jgi:type II secretory pathway component PulF
MPYFRWSGIDMYGNTRKGTLFCASAQELDHLLLAREIAVLKATQITPWITRSIRITDKAQFFTQLATLLQAGILLPQALAMVSQQTTHIKLAAQMHAYARHVQQGDSFSDLLADNKDIGEPFVRALIAIGQETGALAAAVQAIAHYFLLHAQLQRTIHSAMRLPYLIGSFFVVIASAIFMCIIPAFASFLAVHEQPIPRITQYMISISGALETSTFWIVAASVLLFLYGSLQFFKNHERIKKWRDAVVLRTPFLGVLVRELAYAQFFQALQLLLERGVSLPKALHCAGLVLSNSVLAACAQQVEYQVQTGTSCAQAFMYAHERYCDHTILGFLATGEESGNMLTMIAHAARVCQERGAARLAWLTTLIQPVIIAALGLLVGLLLYAVYIPLLTMSYTISV